MRHLAFLGAFASLTATACAQEQIPPSDQWLDVHHFSGDVEIDGQLDDHLQHLPAETFGTVFTYGNPDVDAAEITYRVGYSDTHFYVFIQTDAEHVVEHRRGWLWGDGFRVVLTQPEDDGRSPHFYDIGYSPNSFEGYEGFNQVLITYNHQPTWRRLSGYSRSIATTNDDGTGFEAIIAWEDVAPYNPYTSDRLGLNLYFAKAYFTEETGQFPNAHVIVPDEAINDESLPDRNYIPLAFTPPALSGDRALAIRPDRGRISSGEALEANIVAHTATADTARVEIADQNGARIASTTADLSMIAGMTSQSIRLPVEGLEPGRYTAKLRLGENEASSPFTVFPNVDFEALERALSENMAGAEAGLIQTIRFKIGEYRTSLDARPGYEVATDALERWSEIASLLEGFESGANPFEDRVEPYRRAFLSAQDGSLQPYSVNLPDDYDPSRSYPLLVFLHGSAQTDEGLLDTARSDGRFIEIAPFGRDMYEAYASPESQRDIVEAIEDAQRYFNIDSDRILIGGFSMGGYGALRAYAENPELYAGVAVFAGHPNLANEWLGSGHPDYRRAKHYQAFTDVPVFIYHGEADEALDVDQIRQFADSVTAAGGDVTTSYVPGRGHRYQDEATNALYNTWLEQFVEE